VSASTVSSPPCALLNRHGHSVPEAGAVDWNTANGHVLRLVAICTLAEAAGLP
jgi:hypothetical protein